MDSNSFDQGSIIKQEYLSIDDGFENISQNSQRFGSIINSANILEASESNDDTFVDLEFDADYRAKIENLNRFLVKTSVENDVPISHSEFGSYSQNEVSSSFSKPSNQWYSSTNCESQKGALKKHSDKDTDNMVKNKKTFSYDQLSPNRQQGGIDDFNDNISENLFMNCIQSNWQNNNRSDFNNTRKDLFSKELPTEYSSSQKNLFLMASQESFPSDKFDSSYKSTDPVYLQKEVTSKKPVVFSKENASLKSAQLTNPAFKPFKPVFKKPIKSLSQTTSKSLTSENIDNLDSSILCSYQKNNSSKIMREEDDKENLNLFQNSFNISLSNSNQIRSSQESEIDFNKRKKMLPLMKRSVKKKEIAIIRDDNNNEMSFPDIASKTKNRQDTGVDMEDNFSLLQQKSALSPTKLYSQVFEAQMDEIHLVENSCSSSSSHLKKKKIDQIKKASLPLKKKSCLLKSSVKGNSSIKKDGDDKLLSPLRKNKLVSKNTCSKNKEKQNMSKTSMMTNFSSNCSSSNSRYDSILQTCIENFKQKNPHLYSTNHKSLNEKVCHSVTNDGVNIKTKVKSFQESKLYNKGTKTACSLKLKQPRLQTETALSKFIANGSANKSTDNNFIAVDKVCNDKTHTIASKKVDMMESSNCSETSKQIYNVCNLEVEKSFKKTAVAQDDCNSILDKENLNSNISSSTDMTPMDIFNELPEASQIASTQSSAKFGNYHEVISYQESLASNSVNSSLVAPSEEKLENNECGLANSELQSSPVFPKKWSFKTKKHVLTKGKEKFILKKFIRSDKKNKKNLKPCQGNFSSSVKQHLYDLQKKSTFPVWVQCDDCKKWRCLNDTFDPAVLPQKWTCSLNRDSLFSNCNIPEESYDAEEHNRAFTFSKFTLGSVVWVTSGSWGSHWWPGMVDDDPDTDTYFWLPSQSSDPNFYHVTFFGPKVSRAWIKSKDVKSYVHENIPLELKKLKKSHDLEVAIEQANTAVHLQLDERRQKFCFATRYKGSWFVHK